MAYWRINTNKEARSDVRTCDLWYEHGMAFTGDSQGIDGEYASIFKKLHPDDVIFMHHSGHGIGIVGYGVVEEEWDWIPHEGRDKKLYLDEKAKEKYEYRIKVRWCPEFDTRRTDDLTGISVAKYFPINQYRKAFSDSAIDRGIANEIINEMRNPTFAGISVSEEEINSIEILYEEGVNKNILKKFYERNPDARRACIAKHGFICTICEFNFNKYGSIGKGYIHVHHLVPISYYDDKHPIDPVKDLCPVCPNCHAMLHRKSPPYTIDEIKQKLYGESNA